MPVRIRASTRKPLSAMCFFHVQYFFVCFFAWLFFTPQPRSAFCCGFSVTLSKSPWCQRSQVCDGDGPSVLPKPVPGKLGQGTLSPILVDPCVTFVRMTRTHLVPEASCHMICNTHCGLYSVSGAH